MHIASVHCSVHIQLRRIISEPIECWPERFEIVVTTIRRVDPLLLRRLRHVHVHGWLKFGYLCHVDGLESSHSSTWTSRLASPWPIILLPRVSRVEIGSTLVVMTTMRLKHFLLLALKFSQIDCLAVHLLQVVRTVPHLSNWLI